MFSKACEYGIRATIHIAFRSRANERASLKEVAEAIDSPVSFTAKILQSLANDGVINSVKGPSGGYEIPTSKQAKISLQQIVTAIDGDKILSSCGLGLSQCNEDKPCPIHFKFKAIREDLKTMLGSTTVKELTSGLHEGLAFLKL